MLNHNPILAPAGLSGPSAPLCLRYDPNTRILSCGDKIQKLPRRLGRTFNLFLSNPRHCYSRGDILDETGADLEMDDRSVDGRIKFARKAIREVTGKNGGHYLQALYGLGYYFEPHPDNYQPHPARSGAFRVIDLCLPYLSDNTVTIGHTTLDIGRMRLYLGRSFIPVSNQYAEGMKLLFENEPGRTFDHDFIISHLAKERRKSDNHVISNNIIRRLRDAFKTLLPNPEDAHRVIIRGYGVGYTVDREALGAIHPSPEDQIFNLKDGPG